MPWVRTTVGDLMIEEDDGVASDEEFGLEDTIDVFKNLMKETMG